MPDDTFKESNEAPEPEKRDAIIFVADIVVPVKLPVNIPPVKGKNNDNVEDRVVPGTEINQINHQTPLLQRSLIVGMQLPIFEYNGRTTHIEPRPDYVVNVDRTNTCLKSKIILTKNLISRPSISMPKF